MDLGEQEPEIFSEMYDRLGFGSFSAAPRVDVMAYHPGQMVLQRAAKIDGRADSIKSPFVAMVGAQLVGRRNPVGFPACGLEPLGKLRERSRMPVLYPPWSSG